MLICYINTQSCTISYQLGFGNFHSVFQAFSKKVFDFDVDVWIGHKVNGPINLIQ